MDSASSTTAGPAVPHHAQYSPPPPPRAGPAAATVAAGRGRLQALVGARHDPFAALLRPRRPEPLPHARLRPQPPRVPAQHATITDASSPIRHTHGEPPPLAPAKRKRATSTAPAVAVGIGGGASNPLALTPPPVQAWRITGAAEAVTIDPSRLTFSMHRRRSSTSSSDSADDTESELEPLRLEADPRRFYEVAPDGRTVRYVGPARHDFDVAVARSNRPFLASEFVAYFEMSVVNAGDRGTTLSIGLSEPAVPRNCHPGSNPQSFGFWTNGSKAHSGTPTPYGPRFATGDTVGCGYCPTTGVVFFTLNGKNLGEAFVADNPPLFPTVGLHGRLAAVEVNFGLSRFRFELEDYIAISKAVADIEQLIPGFAAPPAVSARYSSHRRARLLLACEHFVGLCHRRGALAASASVLDKRAHDDDAPRLKRLRGDDAAGAALDEAMDADACAAAEDDCVAYLRNVVRPLRAAPPEESDAERAYVEEVAGLLAYSQPLDSPQMHLFSPSHRAAVADAVNHLILDFAGHSSSLLPKIDVLLRQLLHVRCAQSDGSTAPAATAKEDPAAAGLGDLEAAAAAAASDPTPAPTTGARLVRPRGDFVRAQSMRLLNSPPRVRDGDDGGDEGSLASGE
ncbi:hypothetical protein HK405_009602, partial [Cladochytrium tenue]